MNKKLITTSYFKPHLTKADHYAHLLYTPLLSKEGLGEVSHAKGTTSSNSSLSRRRNSIIKAMAELCIMISTKWRMEGIL